MSGVTEKARHLVRQRARHRCEYCLSQQEYVMGRLQIDHIIPQALGGPDDADNLCLACELCNQYKWANVAGADPASGLRVPLFHPRQQIWAEHFAWSSDGVRIIGLTAGGRATVEVLQLNNNLAVTVRRNWVRAGWHPPQS